jgi:hypothetical protein
MRGPVAQVTSLPLGSGQGTPGYWYTYGDSTGVVVPHQPFVYSPVDNCTLPGLGGAACMKSQVPFQGYGAGMGFNFVTSGTNSDGGVSQPSVYDVSQYKGIRFYARADALGPGSQTLAVQFPDVYTDSAYPGAACTVADAGACDYYETALVDLTSDWQEYEVDFANLTQGAGGYPEPALSEQNALGIQFSVYGTAVITGAGLDAGTAGVSFDVCVGDLRFVRP